MVPDINNYLLVFSPGVIPPSSLVFSSFKMVSYINSSANELYTLLNECSAASVDKDENKLNSSYAELKSIWNKKQKVLSVFIHGSDITKLNEQINELGVAINSKEPNEAINVITDCTNTIEAIIENEKISFSNILEMPAIQNQN